MKILIVDGYNVIHKIPSLKSHLGTSLESARNALVSYMAQWRVRCKFTGDIRIVFDGKNELYGPMGSVQMTPPGICCFFSHSTEEADTYIVRMLKAEATSSEITVVTDDTFIQNHCKVYSAHSQPVSYLETQSISGIKKKHERYKASGGSTKNISHTDKQEINNYLKKVWKME